MKKLFFIFSVLITNVGWGQVTLSVNNFNFSGNLSANGWTVHSGGTTYPISTTTGLSFTNYSGSGIGNGALISGIDGGQDVNVTFPEQSVNGQNIYASFLVNVTDASTSKSGDCFFHLGHANTPNTNFPRFSALVFAKFDASGKVKFGLSNDYTATYGTTDFAKNTTYLIILKYTITTGNPPVSMWVYSQGQDFSTEPNTGAQVVNTTTNNGSGINWINAIGLRQGSFNQPEVIIDGIRIATSWARVLPVTFTSFAATKDGKNNLLSWSTASEQNNAGFEVQRSIDGTTYENIGFVKSLSATGNSSTPLSYTFTDFSPLGLQQYYRIKQTDLDGKFAYSAIVLVKREAPATLTVTKVYPNPSTSSIYINAACPAATALQLAVVDMNGRVLGRKQVNALVGNNGFDMPVAQLAPGTYLLQVINADNKVVTTEKFIKQ